jgi:hypothetical protein
LIFLGGPRDLIFLGGSRDLIFLGGSRDLTFLGGSRDLNFFAGLAIENSELVDKGKLRGDIDSISPKPSSKERCLFASLAIEYSDKRRLSGDVDAASALLFLLAGPAIANREVSVDKRRPRGAVDTVASGLGVGLGVESRGAKSGEERRKGSAESRGDTDSVVLCRLSTMFK